MFAISHSVTSSDASIQSTSYLFCFVPFVGGSSRLRIVQNWILQKYTTTINVILVRLDFVFQKINLRKNLNR